MVTNGQLNEGEELWEPRRQRRHGRRTNLNSGQPAEWLPYRRPSISARADISIYLCLKAPQHMELQQQQQQDGGLASCS